MTPSQMLRLQETIEKNTEAVAKLSHELELHNAKQETFEKQVIKHELVLYGTEERKGLIQRFDIVEDKVMNTFKGFSTAFWIMTGASLTGFAVWFWQTFIAGLVKP